MSRGELAKRIGDLCSEITGTAPVPAPFTYDDVALAEALLRVVAAWNTHGATSQLDPVALAFWAEWHDGNEGCAFDSDAFRSGAYEMHQRVADALCFQFPDDWQPIDE